MLFNEGDNMDLRNEKSKIYCLGCRFLSIAVIVLIIFYFINRSNEILANKLFVIQQLSLGLLLILSGTRKIFAEKDKKGYFDYFLGGAILIIFIDSFLVKCF